MAFVKRIGLLLAITLIAAACGSDDPDVAADSGDAAPATTTTIVADTTTTTIPSPDPGGDGIVAQEGDSVAVHYVGTLDDGTEFDASRPRGATLDFVIGSGGMIAGFDQGVRGMAVGEVKTIRIEPADAYGVVNPDLIEEIDVSLVPPGTKVGDPLVDPNTGRTIRVVAVEEGTVTIDRNHELAGQALTFEIEMVAINP